MRQIDHKFINLQEGWRRIADRTLAVKAEQLLSNVKENMENVAEMIVLVLGRTDINVKKVFDKRDAPSTLINFIEKHAAGSGLIQNVNTVAETIFQQGVFITSV